MADWHRRPRPRRFRRRLRLAGGLPPAEGGRLQRQRRPEPDAVARGDAAAAKRVIAAQGEPVILAATPTAEQ